MLDEDRIGQVCSYRGKATTIISIENDHNMNQWYKYKCPKPKCGCEWKEKIHNNDGSDNLCWIVNAPC